MPDADTTPGIIDRRIGACIRCRREMLGLSVYGLAARLGRPAHLIEDYEAGRVRVGAAALLALTQVLQVEIGYFLRSLAQDAPPPAPFVGLDRVSPSPDRD